MSGLFKKGIMEIGRKFEGIEASSEGFFSTIVTMAIFKLDGISPSSKDLLNSDTSPGSNICLR